MDERYGSTMELDAEPWKRTVKSVINETEKMNESFEQTKKNFSFIDDSGVARMKSQLEQLEAYIEKTENKPTTFLTDSETRKLYDAKVEAQEIYEALRAIGEMSPVEVFNQEDLAGVYGANSAITEAIMNTGLLGDEAQDTADDVRQIGDAVDESKEKADGLPDSIKKMGLALFGVGSAFGAFRKIVSTALSNNIELSNKFKAIWEALGNAITPILNRIANLILTVFSYLNVFVKTLSGGKIDLLAKTSKSAKSTAGSMKEASKYLAGFDELQNVDDDTSGGGGGGGIDGITDPFKDVNLNPEWVDRIQKFGEWVKENWVLVVALLASTWVALKAGADLKDLTVLWLTLGGVYEFCEGLNKIFEGWKNGDLKMVSDGFKDIALAIGLLSVAISIATGDWKFLYNLLWAGVALVASWITEHWEEIKYAFHEIVDAMKYQWEGFKRTISTLVENIKTAVVNKWNEIKTNFGTMVDGLKTKWNDFKTNLVSKFEDVKNSIKSKINSIIGFFEGLQHKGADVINNITSGINSKLKISIPSWIPVIGGKSWSPNIGKVPYAYFNRLDTGTNYVPNDQLAMIHKGEAVIPKKFNSEEYFNNAETAEKLDRVIDLLENIDFQPYITVKDIGATATKYQAQQVRIMGGKV